MFLNFIHAQIYFPFRICRTWKNKKEEGVIERIKKSDVFSPEHQNFCLKLLRNIFSPQQQQQSLAFSPMGPPGTSWDGKSFSKFRVPGSAPLFISSLAASAWCLMFCRELTMWRAVFPLNVFKKNKQSPIIHALEVNSENKVFPVEWWWNFLYLKNLKKKH